MRFLNGLLVGGLAGALFGLYYLGTPKRTGARRYRYLIGETRRLGKRTGKFVADMAQEVGSYLRK